jgi:putative ABC transport system permease protein
VLLENFFLALKAIWANKMRSILTTLGIVIGTSAVIAVVSIVQGLSQVITGEVENLGANTVIVSPYRPPGKEGEKLARVELTWEDGQYLLETVPSISAGTPVLQQFSSVKYEDTSAQYPVIGGKPEFQDLRNYYVERGRFITPVDDRERQNVTVIGHGVIKELKLPDDPIGKTLTIRDRAFRIVGIFEKRGELFGQEFDKFVMIPCGTAIGMYGDTMAKQSTALLIRARAADRVQQAIDEIEDALRVRHALRPDQPNDFRVQSQQEFLKTISKFFDGVTYVVAGVVSIALLVGGIGIMNIMLVSVTERTREIGVRKAVGARRGHILQQFVIEAITLALVGGVIGIVVGFGVGQLAAKLIPNWPGAVVPLWAVVLAFGFSSAVGLFFGIYPAAKASRLDPIESLRYE